MDFKRHPEQTWNQMLSTPFIFAMAVPLVFLDVCGEVYHHVCFPLYGIPLLKRKLYFVYDRALLPYLQWDEKFYCLYCSYANGLLHYMTAIGGQTERYWCGIKHAKYKNVIPQPHQSDFLPYNNEAAFRKFTERIVAEDEQ